MPNPLDDLTGKNVIVDDVPMPDRKVLEFVSGDGVTFEATDDSVNGRTVIEVGGGSASGTLPVWDFSSSTADADPGEGTFRLNVGSSSATFIYISDQEELEVDWAEMVARMNVGNFILIQQPGTDARYLCRVTGPVTDAVGYTKIPIVVVSTRGGVGFTDGERCSFNFYSGARSAYSADCEGMGNGGAANVAFQVPSAAGAVVFTERLASADWAYDIGDCSFECITGGRWLLTYALELNPSATADCYLTIGPVTLVGTDIVPASAATQKPGLRFFKTSGATSELVTVSVALNLAAGAKVALLGQVAAGGALATVGYELPGGLQTFTAIPLT
jgi:hypothetical protein